MPYSIDKTLCGECGSCFSICSNRAVVKREGVYLVTEMCSDCGVCIPFCPTGAIGKGKSKAEFDNKMLDKALKDKLSLKRHIAAMKYADQAPQGVRVEEGPHFWCAICGDIFEGKGTQVFFTAKASTCGGSAMIGVGVGKYTRDEFEAALQGEVTGEGKLFATKNEMTKARCFFPRYPKVFGGMILGSLEEMSMPDLIIFPVNGDQMCMISTAYTFDTGEVISGFAGSATCMMTVAIPYLENRPVFSSGDYSGRDFMRLKDEEIVVCFPYRLVPGLVKHMERTVYARDSNESE
ncbi:MAG: hypothetical protein AMJ42_04795 [Deltaproteobacteria bacterium DG_8]|nr:MAG: hypothetical protein AMJ42_04795 [Deltaproteobacteria bacterium DG_8]